MEKTEYSGHTAVPFFAAYKYMCAGQAGHATKEVITMKKLLALLLVLCLSLTVVSVLAEEEYEEDETQVLIDSLNRKANKKVVMIASEALKNNGN